MKFSLMFGTRGYMMYILFIVILLSQCSAKRQPLRVYGGEDAEQGAYSYVVRLEIRHLKHMGNGKMLLRQMHLCTASALSSTWLVTAAHCLLDLHEYLEESYHSKLVIRYGSVNGLPNDKNVFSRVDLMIQHPLYVFRDSDTAYVVKNDIALIKTSSMPLKRYIKLSPVDINTLYGHEAVSCGFGFTANNTSINETITGSTLDLKKPLQIFKALINKCKTNLQSGPLICLGHRCGSIVTAYGGDSGGPVIHPSGIIGVLAQAMLSKYCEMPSENTNIDDAGFFTPVGPYVEWIASYVRN